MKKMTRAFFITLVAKDTVTKQFGPMVKDWPEANFWTLVSSTRDTIEERHMPGLLKSYGVTLIDEVQP